MKNERILGMALMAIFAFMLIYGFVQSEAVDAFKIYWMAAACAAIPGALLLANQGAAARYFSRIVVGSIFIVSGLIKANDTVGFGIKLEEYFDENALGAFWALFHDWAWAISFFVSGLEVLLGLALLFGIRVQWVSYALLGMTLFFGWLTYFTAQCNDAQMAAIRAGEDFNRVCVTDCGCFGDALRGSVGRSLTPWESFYKDIGLLFMVLVLVAGGSRIRLNVKRDDLIIFPFSLLITLLFGGWLFGWMLPTYFLLISIGIYYLFKVLRIRGIILQWAVAVFFVMLTYGFASYTYLNLPVKDYRPYAVGINIKDQMKDAAELGLEPTIEATIYKLENKRTGEVKTVNSREYLEQEIWKDEDWNNIVYSSPEPIVLKRGYEPPIASFTVFDEDGIDIGDELLNDANYSFMVVMYDVEKANTRRHLRALKNLIDGATAAGHRIYVLTGSSYDEYEPFRHEHGLAIPFYEADAIMLKTIVRSNPGLLLLRDGKILEKWHGNNIPLFKTVEMKHFNPS